LAVGVALLEPALEAAIDDAAPRVREAALEGLAEATGSRVHIAHISTAGAVEIVRQAKARGVPVTAEVTPHHLALTHEAVLLGPGEVPGGPSTAPTPVGALRTCLAYDTNAKVNPPLRTQADADACVAGLLDGTINCIATDHAPHAIQDKLCEFDTAAFGISGLETAFALSFSALVPGGQVSNLTGRGSGTDPLYALIERLTIAPVRTLGLDRRFPGLGTLGAAAPADVVLIDPDAEWTVEPETFASKGKNTPLAGRTLKSRVIATTYKGKVVLQG
jgi:dihydroorotase